MKWSELLAQLGGFGSRRMAQFGFFPFVVILMLSLLCAMFIAHLYTRFYKSRATGSLVHRTFPLLGISVTAIFICVQFSLPLSLGLLGALSIVRFRTPIKEPEEIGFILLVIAASLCCATFNMFFLGILLMVALLALVIQKAVLSKAKGQASDGAVMVRLPAGQFAVHGTRLTKMLSERLPRGRLDSVTESGKESVICYSFVEADAAQALEIKSVEQQVAGSRVDIFFSRPGEV